MAVGECIQKHTYRQFLAWQEWLDEDMNRVGKQEHYLAQLTAEVRRGNVKNPNSVKNETFHIKFTRKGEDVPVSEETVAIESAKAKARWAGRLGLTIPGGVPEPKRIGLSDDYRVEED